MPSGSATDAVALCGEIRGAYARLTRTERRVADLVLADPAAALETATARLAAAAQVSQPQVIRFCRAIGFDGVASFKRALGASLALSSHGLTPRASHPTLARSLQALGRMDALHDAHALAAAGAALAAAAQVDVWADDGHRPIIDLAVRALWRLGSPARAALPGDAASGAAGLCLLLGAGALTRCAADAALAVHRPVVLLTAQYQVEWPAKTIQLVTGPEPSDTPSLLALQMLHLLLAEARHAPEQWRPPQ